MSHINHYTCIHVIVRLNKHSVAIYVCGVCMHVCVCVCTYPQCRCYECRCVLPLLHSSARLLSEDERAPDITQLIEVTTHSHMHQLTILQEVDALEVCVYSYMQCSSLNSLINIWERVEISRLCNLCGNSSSRIFISSKYADYTHCMYTTRNTPDTT